MRDEITNAIEFLRTADEAAMRDFKSPWPESIDELAALITAVTNREHGYGTCVYAMSIAAECAFNYVAYTEGCTGFQASMADLDVVRRTRSLKGPFALIDGNDLLYPQHDIRGRIEELISKWQPWAKKEAQKLLDSNGNGHGAHPDVKAHWQKLAEVANA